MAVMYEDAVRIKVISWMLLRSCRGMRIRGRLEIWRRICLRLRA